MAARSQAHFAQLAARDSGDAIVFRQPLVEKGPVRMDELRHAAVRAQDFVEEQLRLARHGPEQKVVEFAVALRVRRGGVELAQVEPLAGEVLGEATRLRVGQEVVRG